MTFDIFKQTHGKSIYSHRRVRVAHEESYRNLFAARKITMVY